MKEKMYIASLNLGDRFKYEGEIYTMMRTFDTDIDPLAQADGKDYSEAFNPYEFVEVVELV